MSENNEKKTKTLVKFIRSFTPYVKGEVAGFNKSFADKLINKGIAEKFAK